MDDHAANAFDEIRRLGEAAHVPAGLERIRTLIEELRDDPRATEQSRAKLLDALNWFEVLFSEERRRRYAASGGTDGAAMVRTFACADLEAARSAFLRTRMASQPRFQAGPAEPDA